MTDTLDLTELTKKLETLPIAFRSITFIPKLEPFFNIPLGFIEKNLPLIIESGYTPTEVLKHIVKHPSELSNPFSLIEKLISDYKANVHELSSISSELDSSSIELLLSEGMKGDALLRAAADSYDEKKQIALFDLAFAHDAKTSSFKDLHIPLKNCHKDVFEILIDKHKVPAQDLFNIVICSSFAYLGYTKEQIANKLSELEPFFLTKGANLNKDAFKYIPLHNISEEFIEKNLPLIIESGYTPTEVLKRVVEYPYAFANPSGLIKKLISDHKADAHELSSISSELDSSSIELLLSEGMKGDVLLRAAAGSYNEKKQIALFDLAFEHGTNVSSFKDLHIPLKNCHKDVFEILIDKHRVSAQDLFNIVIRSSFAYYIDYTKEQIANKLSELEPFCLTKGANLNKDTLKGILIRNISEEFIEKNLSLIIESGYTPTEVLKRVVEYPYAFANPFGLIEKLISDYKADAHELSSISSNLDSSSIELLLSKGMKGDALLSAAAQENDKEKQQELFELAFKHAANTSSFKDLEIPLTNCHKDVFEILIDKHGVLAHYLLDIVVRSSSSYFYINYTKEQIANQQSELMQFCLAKGAKLNKDVFKEPETHNISVGNKELLEPTTLKQGIINSIDGLWGSENSFFPTLEESARSQIMGAIGVGASTSEESPKC